MGLVLRAIPGAELAGYTWCLEILLKKEGAAQLDLHEGPWPNDVTICK